MEGATRFVQNRRRMDSGRNGNICRRFLRGCCRYGPRCNYRHERPDVPSGVICRHFQKGGCWYGDRCRFVHILPPETDTAVAGRRSSVPTVLSSHVALGTADRRGSEPALLQGEATSVQICSQSERVHIGDLQHNPERPLLNISLEQAEDAEHVPTFWESMQRTDATEAGACNERHEQTYSTARAEEGAEAAASAALGEVEEVDTFLQSENMTCGICMEKVYEKTEPRERLFGILPNCNHPFCLQCIMTWRKTKDFGPDVVKSCPHCRVRSAFYMPNKRWVEGQAKEDIISAFKEKCRKKSCGYFARYRCCPFKSECLYRHDKPHPRSIRYPVDDDEDIVGLALLDLFVDLALSGDYGIDEESGAFVELSGVYDF